MENLKLDLSELEIESVEIEDATAESVLEALTTGMVGHGITEIGASSGTTGCCSNGCCCSDDDIIT